MKLRLLLLAFICFLSPAFANGDPEGKYATGLVRPQGWDLGRAFLDPTPVAPQVLPAKWDWREKGVVTPVKDQANCGSCWAFGSTAVFESAVKIKDGAQTPNFSEQQLVSCDRSAYGCNGGFYAHDFQMRYGQASEEAFPYKARDLFCKRSLQPAAKLGSWTYIGSRGQSPSVDQLKQAIYTFGPVATVVYANNALMNYRGGVFKGCESRSTNHLVVIVGWDESTKTWIMRNSWGVSWGEQGYGRLPYGCSNIGESATAVVYKPACPSTPMVSLPATAQVASGHDVELSVPQQAGVTYEWHTEGEPVGKGSKVRSRARGNRHYTVVATSPCGKSEATVAVSQP